MPGWVRGNPGHSGSELRVVTGLIIMVSTRKKIIASSSPGQRPIVF